MRQLTLCLLAGCGLVAANLQGAEINIYPLALPSGSLSGNFMRPVADHHLLGGVSRIQLVRDPSFDTLPEEQFGFFSLGARYELRPNGERSGPYAAAQFSVSYALVNDNLNAWPEEVTTKPEGLRGCDYRREVRSQHLLPVLAAGFRWQWPNQLHSQLGVSLNVPVEFDSDVNIKGLESNDYLCPKKIPDTAYQPDVSSQTAGAYFDSVRLIGFEWAVGYRF